MITPGARRAPFDRDPLVISKVYSGAGVAPAGVTQRWTYTVPAARKCLVGLMQASVNRKTAAGAVGNEHCYVRYTPSGGAAVTLLFAKINGNTVNDKDGAAVGAGMVLHAGDQLEGVTYSDSTTGTVDYTLTFQGTEFAA